CGLRLEEHGLRWCHAPLVLAHPLADGRCAVLSRDLPTTAESLSLFAGGDGEAWEDMVREWRRVSGPFLGALFRPFPPVLPGAALVARLGVVGALRFLRHLLLPVRRMAEERFQGEGAALLLGGNALHSDVSPEAAGSGLFGWLLACLGQEHGFPVPEGGAGGLTAALVHRLEARGGVLRCGERVVEVVVRGGHAVGVRTASGEHVGARRAVIADVPAPVLYGGLVGREHLPAGVVDDIGRFQWDMATVKVDWALDGPVPWCAPDARRAGTLHIADDFDNFTEFTGHVAMKLLPARPFLIVGQQSVADPTRAPQGSTTVWGYTHVPRAVRGDAGSVLDVTGGEASWGEGFVARMEARIEALAPGFGQRVLARHVFLPSQLGAADPSLVGGAVNGGTAQLHQQLVFRPIPGAGRPETAVTGLYLASASAHPGGGVHGGAGANAARAALLPFARARAVVAGRRPMLPPG
ncbi:MAG TPA: NAD(P)/FAD-dependent oxidoreductase, partial [Acidimicrobiales bacterium]|nr:NAD(P)/FAD-dependent oxidoreductase [Acidimicrobiales bacterium]